jgi:signal transduction histidine kinase
VRHKDLGLARAFLALLALIQEKDRRLSGQRNLLAMVSHELRAPLSTILTGAEAIRQNPNSEASLRKTAERMRRAGLRMQRLINDLLDITAIDAGKLTIRSSATEVNWLLEQVRDLEAAAAERGIRLQIDWPGESMAVLCETDRIVQVLSNLIANALKHSPPDSTVCIGARRRDAQVDLFVEDNGPGISPRLLPIIFDRFARGELRPDAGGTGLGLAIAREIVVAHGGHIWAENRRDTSGARFTFSLNVSDGC